MTGKWWVRIRSRLLLQGAGHKLRHAAALMWRYVPRLLNFWISLLGLASFTVIIWLFYPLEDTNAKVLITALYAFVSFLYFLAGINSDQQDRELDLSATWTALLSVATLIVVLADRADLPALGINVISILISLPAVLALSKLAKGRWLLLFAIVPSIVAASIYLVPPITPSGVVLDYLFVPLPVVSYICVAWAFVTKWFLIRAEQSRGRPTRGPAMESLSMLFLFTPLIVLTMLAANALGFGETWVAVSGVVVSLIFSSAISMPVRQFLLDLGNLSTNRGLDGD